MSGISTHVLDTARGRPAAGVAVELQRADGAGTWCPLGRGRTDDDGRLTGLLAHAPAPGRYRLCFDTGAYFAATGQTGFYPEVSVTFQITGEDGHYHVPLLLNPYGYSTYRGS